MPPVTGKENIFWNQGLEVWQNYKIGEIWLFHSLCHFPISFKGSFMIPQDLGSRCCQGLEKKSDKIVAQILSFHVLVVYMDAVLSHAEICVSITTVKIPNYASMDFTFLISHSDNFYAG